MSAVGLIQAFVIPFLTLTILEIILGVDNIAFISIQTGKLEPRLQPSARHIGMLGAFVLRLLLLLALIWVLQLDTPIFSIWGFSVSIKDILMFIGGLFLMGKATLELHHMTENGNGKTNGNGKLSFLSTVAIVIVMDAIFSLDAVMLAIGMGNNLGVMIAALTASVLVMLFAVGKISNFIHSHMTVKTLTLSFLLLIGFSLVAEGTHLLIPRGYIYFALGFAFLVELFNMRIRKSLKPKKKH